MPALKLTRAAVEKIQAPHPDGRQGLYWDTELRGFGLLVSAKTDAKAFIAQRRLPDGRTRRVTIGAVSEWPTVEAARRKAGSMLIGLREGKDPKAERQRRAVADRTLEDWLGAYLTGNKALRPRSVEEYRRSVTRHLSPWLSRPLRDLTPQKVEEAHASLGKTVGPAAANSAMRALRAVWNFALDRDSALPANPVRILRRKGWFPVEARTRSVREHELPAFCAAIAALPNTIARDYLLLLLFTGLRRREAAALRWDEVDLTGRVIRLSPARTKAGRALALPMGSFVRDMLIARRAVEDDAPWVFSADSRSGHIEEPKFALQIVGNACGVRVSAHDLRRTFATVAESADISPLALKALLNHALPSGDVTAGYVQMTEERLREPVQRVTDRMMKLCGISEPEGRNVVRIA